MPNTDMVQCMNHVKASSETACESINVRKIIVSMLLENMVI